MLTPDDKVGGWVKKGQNHDDVILEWSLITTQISKKNLDQKSSKNSARKNLENATISCCL